VGRGGRAPSAADTVVCALRVVACHVYKVYHLSNHYTRERADSERPCEPPRVINTLYPGGRPFDFTDYTHPPIRPYFIYRHIHYMPTADEFLNI